MLFFLVMFDGNVGWVVCEYMCNVCNYEYVVLCEWCGDVYYCFVFVMCDVKFDVFVSELYDCDCGLMLVFVWIKCGVDWFVK